MSFPFSLRAAAVPRVRPISVSPRDPPALSAGGGTGISHSHWKSRSPLLTKGKFMHGPLWGRDNAAFVTSHERCSAVAARVVAQRSGADQPERLARPCVREVVGSEAARTASGDRPTVWERSGGRVSGEADQPERLARPCYCGADPRATRCEPMPPRRQVGRVAACAAHSPTHRVCSHRLRWVLGMSRDTVSPNGASPVAVGRRSRCSPRAGTVERRPMVTGRPLGASSRAGREPSSRCSGGGQSDRPSSSGWPRRGGRPSPSTHRVCNR